MIKMLIGLPGCGKSTYAKKFPNFVVLSSDSIRGELFGDESVQSNPALVFQVLYERMEDALQTNKNVIFDATNIKIRDRKQALDLAEKYNVPVEGIVFDIPLDVCLERNAQRERQVPYEAYERMLAQYVKPTLDEGFSSITFITE